MGRLPDPGSRAPPGLPIEDTLASMHRSMPAGGAGTPRPGGWGRHCGKGDGDPRRMGAQRAAWVQGRRRRVRYGAMALLALLALPRPALSGSHLDPPVLRPLLALAPWPALSGLVVHRGRLWFVHSVRYPDHDSADLYSLSLLPGGPDPGSLRFERTLFSQDAGRPAVHQGRLWWPFEDPRMSLGWGHVAETDGSRWWLHVIPTRTSVFHVHALASLPPPARGGGRQGARLLASTSAWAAGLDASDDGGRHWWRLYERGGRSQGVVRMPWLVSARDLLLAGGYARRRPGTGFLLRLDGNRVAPVRGWKGRRVRSLVPRGGCVTALPEPPGADRGREERRPSVELLAICPGGISPLPADLPEWPKLLGGAPGALAAVTGSGTGRARGGSVVHESPDGAHWRAVARLAGGEPLEVMGTDRMWFAAGRGTGGQGVLWAWPRSGLSPAGTATGLAPPRPGARPGKGARPGSPPPAPLPAGPGAPGTPSRPAWSPACGQSPSNARRAPGPREDSRSALRALEAALREPESYLRHARVLRDCVWSLVRAGVPPGYLGTRLEGPFPPGRVPTFGGALTASRADLGRWVLLWGMALAGREEVPPALLERPWSEAPNEFAKWFHPTPMALFALRWTGQRDGKTVRALIERLRRAQGPGEREPAWLRHEIGATLVTLTGAQPPLLGPDRARPDPVADARFWTRWWEESRP